MAHPQPPVPPDQQSDVIRGASSPTATPGDIKRDPGHDTHGASAASRGQEGNRGQNLQPSHSQQDR